MRERPILFSAPMVRAILDGSKTQTRRVVKIPAPTSAVVGHEIVERLVMLSTGPHLQSQTGYARPLPESPYGKPGDQLWVREAFRLDRDFDGLSPRLAHSHCEGYWFEASRPALLDDVGLEARGWGRLRPGIHLPRWASRISLEVTEIGVAPLQAITESDARAEGMPPPDPLPCTVNGQPGRVAFFDPRKAFAVLWDAINGEGSFVANPWVWVVSFRRVRP